MKQATWIVSGVLIAGSLGAGACNNGTTPDGSGGATGGTSTGGGTPGSGGGTPGSGGAGTGGAGTGGDAGGMGGMGGFGGMGGAGVTERWVCDELDSLEMGDDPSFEITSPDFDFCEPIPADFSCDGKAFASGVSPELEWTAGPPETASYAIVFKDLSIIENADPDPIIYNRGFHWVIWDIPTTTSTLESAVEGGHHSPDVAGARQWGTWNDYSYLGPCPNPFPDPEETFLDSYSFTLYALPDATIAEEDLPEMDGANWVRVMDEYLASVAVAVTEYRGTSAAQATSGPSAPAAVQYPCTETLTSDCLEAP